MTLPGGRGSDKGASRCFCLSRDREGASLQVKLQLKGNIDVKKEIAIPLAYFITFTCYGTWLHGEKATSVDRQHNIPETEFLSPNANRASSTKKRLIEAPYSLTQLQREVILNVIKEVCLFRAWVLLAAHVRTNHIHLIIHGVLSPEMMMSTIKAYATRRLKELKLDRNRLNWWTRHGSTKYLWKEPHVEAAIEYVVSEQGNPMAVFENQNRAVFYRAAIEC